MPRPRYTEDRTLSRAEIQKAYRERQKQTREQELEKKGLPATRQIPTMPDTPRWNALVDHATATLEQARAEIQEYFDARTEAWQESDRAEAMQKKIDALESALDALAEYTDAG